MQTTAANTRTAPVIRDEFDAVLDQMFAYFDRDQIRREASAPAPLPRAA